MSKTTVSQIIYLDFDGAVAAGGGALKDLGKIEVSDSRISALRAAELTAALNEKFAGRKVLFTLEPPDRAEYSTIRIGKSADIPYTGLAEGTDMGNKNAADNAFVNLDAAATDDELLAVIAHEAGHLLGTVAHDGEGLAAYAYTGGATVTLPRITTG